MIREIKYNREKLKIINHISDLSSEGHGHIFWYFSQQGSDTYRFYLNHKFKVINIISDYLLEFNTELLYSTINVFFKLDNYTIGHDR